LPPRLTRAYPAGDALGDVPVEMIADFVVEFALD
jgi:hypothetical protein